MAIIHQIKARGLAAQAKAALAKIKAAQEAEAKEKPRYNVAVYNDGGEFVGYVFTENGDNGLAWDRSRKKAMDCSLREAREIVVFNQSDGGDLGAPRFIYAGVEATATPPPRLPHPPFFCVGRKTPRAK